MRICYFADAESIHIVRWCKHFASLGHEIHLISFKNIPIEGIKTYFIDCGKINVRGGNWKVLFQYKKVKKLLQQIRPDIFHAHYATSYGITGALCNYHPYIITAHGTDVLISPNQSIVYKLLLKFAFSKADQVTTVANHMKIAIEKLRVKQEKIAVIPLGIDPSIFNTQSRSLPTDKFVITSTRNFEKVYNIPHLIKAIEEVIKSIPNVQLNLIGSGSLEAELKKLVNEKGFSANTTFYGKVDQNKIAEVLKQSHIYISTSLSDGNSISLSEAMACGTFCIVTNIPANQEWIKDGENGFTVQINDNRELAEKIIDSCKNWKDLSSKAIVHNLQIIRKFGAFAKNMENIEKMYQSVLLKTD